jgi:hypothetical protein
MTGPFMPGHRYTPAEFALQQKVESFGNLLYQLEEAQLTHIYWVVVLFCEYKIIGYVVLQYHNTGTLLFEEYSEDWLFNGEA